MYWAYLPTHHAMSCRTVQLVELATGHAECRAKRDQPRDAQDFRGLGPEVRPAAGGKSCHGDIGRCAEVGGYDGGEKSFLWHERDAAGDGVGVGVLRVEAGNEMFVSEKLLMEPLVKLLIEQLAI